VADDEYIHIYTRAMAIRDGILVDVSEVASGLGYKHPVALTIGVWSRCSITSERDRGVPLDVRQAIVGWLWDVLMLLRAEVRKMKADSDRVDFTVSIAGEDVKLYSLCGPGDDAEPVITILLHHED